VHSQSCFFTTAVWGRWHTDMFLSVNLPTLLAPGNLPAFARLIPTRYRIFTTTADRDAMRRSHLLGELRCLVELEIIEIPPDSTVDPIVAHHRLWGQSMAEAAEQGALTVLMPPDVLWSDGSFAHVARAITAGKSAVFMSYLRVISETFVREFLNTSAAPARGVRAIAPRPLLDMAFRHLHPVIAAYRRDSERFPRHAEMMIWPVSGDGFLLRLLARELFVLDPRRFKLTPWQLLRDAPDLADVHVVTNSDDLLGLSLTPFLKDSDWYASPLRVDAGAVARWMLEYDSPSNDMIARQNLRFHLGNAGADQWRRVERQADALIQRCLLTREALRIAKALELMGCESAAQLLASALARARLARHWRIRGPIVVLAPDESAFEDFDLPGWLRGDAAAKLRGAIDAHVAPLPPELTAIIGEPFETLRRVRLRTVAGEDVTVTIEPPASATLAGDRIAMAPQCLWSGRNLVIRTERLMLSPEETRAPLEQTRAGAA
jgi:hypothetical protein